MAMQTLKSSTRLTDGVRVECEVRDHKLILDEPEDLGGTDTGMNPVEALLSALGGCKCIVARFLAKVHRIDLQEFKVEMEGDLDLDVVMDGFMGKDYDGKIGLETIRTKVYIKSSSPKEDIEKFVQAIDNTCPVQDSLVNPPEMVTEVNIED